MRVDPVRELIERILAASAREGGFTESIALEVERSFRHDYNGETCYIKERTDDTITSKKTAVVAATCKTSLLNKSPSITASAAPRYTATSSGNKRHVSLFTKNETRPPIT